MDIESAVKYALDGEAILFLGAGFSIGGTNSDGEIIVAGSGLSHKLCDKMGTERSDNLTIVSSRYVDDPIYKKGVSSLISLLLSELTCTKTSGIQDNISQLPWIRIYTTNYDDVIEKASIKNGIIRKSITATSSKYESDKSLDEAIIHINGFIQGLNEKKFEEEFKITDDNYVKNGFLDSRWADLFKTDLERAKAVIFVGYSLDYDQDIKKMLARLCIKDKCIFIDIESLDDNNSYKLNKYGNLYKFGAEGLSEEIERVRSFYTPHEKIIQLQGFEQVDIEDYYTQDVYSSIDVVDLIIKGYIKRKYINQEGYCLKRRQTIKEVIEELKESKIVIIRSKLGNGKTIFAECLANELCKNNNVYFAKNLFTMHDDVDLILNNSEKDNIIIVDDYGYYIKLLKEFSKEFPENLKLVLTCRTAININLYYDLTNKYRYKDISIIDIDKLKESELYELVNLLDINRLWGDYDRLSSNQKRKILRKEFNSNISKIFYLLLRSESIRDQVKKIIDLVFEFEGLKNFVLAQAVNSICNLKLKYYDICKFVNISTNLLDKYSMDPSLSEIIDFNSGSFNFTSSIFSQYIIRQSEMDKEIIDMLKTIYIESSNADYSNKYRDQRKMLISRSNIILLFTKYNYLTVEEEKKVFEYFDKIKNTPTASDNPFFWLQFGITALNLKEYNLASIYFDNAYSNISGLDNFDAFQLDTHKARLILNKEIDTNRTNKENALYSFKEAHRLLVDNSNSGKNLRYVLKQTGIYYRYFNTYSKLLNDNEKSEYLKKAFEIFEKYMRYFKIDDINIIPNDIVDSYRKFRKLFNKTQYALQINDLDRIFNNKLPGKRYRVFNLDIL